jgi:poly(A) polymerase
MPPDRRRTIAAMVAGVVVAAVVLVSMLVFYVPTSSAPTAASDCAPTATAPETVAPGWNASFRAGCPDPAGNETGGSELMHLVGHDGMLFAAVGYWEDTANIYYGGTNASQGWAQILRLSGPNAKWAVDLTMTGVVRPEILKSVTFTTNATGVPLSHPVNLLLAGGCLGGTGGVNVYTRNDSTGTWVASKIASGPAGLGCDNMSVRAMTTYQDPITGVDRVFVSVGDLGIFSGVYDPAVPGDVLWGRASESGNVAVRPLAIVEANGNLLASAGALIYERVNGPSPSWKVVVNETTLPGGTDVDPAVGGIRGLTAIPNPNGSGQSLLFLWCPGDAPCGTVMRLDPNGSGGYHGTTEIDLSNLVSKYLGTTAAVALGAYNNFLPVTDPATGETDYLIGLQTWVSARSGLPMMPWANSTGGTYAGALYAIRESNGTYRMGEVNGVFPAGNPPLEAVRSYTISPFPSDNGSVIYFGGYDTDGHPCLNTAWVFRTTLANALGEVEASQTPRDVVSPHPPVTDPLLMRPRLTAVRSADRAGIM